MRLLRLLYIILLILLITAVVLPIALTCRVVSVKDIAQVFLEYNYTRVIFNTAAVTFTSALFSTLIGFFYAYIIINNKTFFARFFSFIPIVHLVTPPVVSGLSFILLFGKNGFILHTLFHLDISLYGFYGIVLSQVIYFFPISYIINSVALKNVSSEHIAAARLMGAGPLKIFFSITIPESSSGILSSALFIAVSVMSDFGNPVIVGGRYQVLSTEIYSLVTGAIEPKKAIVLAIVLLAPSLLLFLTQNIYFIKNKARFAIAGANNIDIIVKSDSRASLGGSSVTQSRTNKALNKRNVGGGLWAVIAGTAFCALFTLIIMAQFGSVAVGSFQRLWGVDTTFTLSHIKRLGLYGDAFFNTIMFSLSATIITVVVAIFSAYFSVINISLNRRAKVLSSIIDTMAQLPQAVCGVMMGLCYSYTAGVLKITNYSALIISVMVVMFLPFAHKTIVTGFLQQKEQLTLCAISLGASALYALFTVNIPLAARAIKAAIVYTFARCIGTLSAIIFLVSFDTKTISLYILNLTGQGDWGAACSLALYLTTLTIFIIIVMVKLEPQLWKKIAR